MQEQFKDIPDYEGLYQVSNLGTVKALDRYNTDKNGKTKFYPGKILKFDTNVKTSTSYNRVTLSKDGKTKRYFVHRLVCLAFLPNPDNKPYVNHIDNNGLNNNIDNLEWCTHSENMTHSQQQGRQFTNQSKAGKVAGTKLRTEVLEEISSNINKVFDNLKILSYDTHRSGKHHVNCECLFCGSTTSIRYREVVNQKIKTCNKCKNTYRNKI